MFVPAEETRPKYKDQDRFFDFDGQTYHFVRMDKERKKYPVVGESVVSGKEYSFSDTVLINLRYADGTKANVTSDIVKTKTSTKKKDPEFKRFVLVCDGVCLPIYHKTKDELLDEIKLSARQNIQAGDLLAGLIVAGCDIEFSVADVLGEAADEIAQNPSLIDAALRKTEDWQLKVYSILEWFRDEGLNDEKMEPR